MMAIQPKPARHVRTYLYRHIQTTGPRRRRLVSVEVMTSNEMMSRTCKLARLGFSEYRWTIDLRTLLPKSTPDYPLERTSI